MRSPGLGLGLGIRVRVKIRVRATVRIMVRFRVRVRVRIRVRARVRVRVRVRIRIRVRVRVRPTQTYPWMRTPGLIRARGPGGRSLNCPLRPNIQGLAACYQAPYKYNSLWPIPYCISHNRNLNQSHEPTPTGPASPY